ncbi:MAG TPA: FecR domain-containing protein [Steroidobacter sp.]
MESHRQIEDEVARWLVKRDSGNWSEGDQAALSQWLDASTARVVAFVRLEAAWKRLQRLQSLGAGTPAGVIPSPDEWQLSPVFDGKAGRPVTRQPWLKYGMAAALAVIACVISARVWLFDTAVYSTPVGGIASVPMTDGSKVTLNTDSRIRVDLSSRERHVRLEQGEAFFQVAKDPSRPFVVTAGDRRVIAVGTAFSVRRDADDSVRVAVTEGTVRVEQQMPLMGRKQAGDMLLPAGNIALTRSDQVMLQEKPLSAVEEAVSWRTGFVVFHETALTEVVAELNRYNTRKIVLQDASLATIRLSGRFEPTQYQAFVRLLENGFAIRATDEGERIVLTAR